MAVTVDDPEVGPTIQAGMPFRLSASPPRSPRPRPAPGQQNDEVFSESRSAPAPVATGASPRYPLDGIRVLDFGRMLAGPYGPMVLAGLGAGVIHVESADETPTGAMMRVSAVLLGCEQGKRSIKVDLKSSEGYEVVRRLV